jgi:nitrile hydratase accessory protein
MFTCFEEYAATSMLGGPESPPRRNGKLQFSSPWERDVFGIALTLAKAGYFEWDDLRQCLIEAIQKWETANCTQRPPWDYYERFLEALLNVIAASEVLLPDEVAAVLVGKRPIGRSTDDQRGIQPASGHPDWGGNP